MPGAFITSLKSGQKFRKFREAMGWTQLDVARGLGDDTNSQVSAFERGVRGMSQERVLKACGLIGISPMWILSPDEDSDEQIKMIIAAEDIIKKGAGPKYKELSELLTKT